MLWLQVTEGDSEAQDNMVDIEDMAGSHKPAVNQPVAHSSKRKRAQSPSASQPLVATSWREALGPPPPFGTSKVSCQPFPENFYTQEFLKSEIIREY